MEIDLIDIGDIHLYYHSLGVAYDDLTAIVIRDICGISKVSKVCNEDLTCRRACKVNVCVICLVLEVVGSKVCLRVHTLNKSVCCNTECDAASEYILIIILVGIRHRSQIYCQVKLGFDSRFGFVECISAELLTFNISSDRYLHTVLACENVAYVALLCCFEHSRFCAELIAVVLLIRNYVSVFIHPAAAVLVLNRIAQIHSSVSFKLLEIISCVAVLMLYLHENINVLVCFDVGRLREIDIQIEINTAFVEPYVYRVLTVVTLRNIAGERIRRLLIEFYKVALIVLAGIYTDLCLSTRRNKVCRLNRVRNVIPGIAVLVCNPVSVHTGYELMIFGIVFHDIL